MATLKDFLPCADDLNIGGYYDLIYVIPACEITGGGKSKDKLATPVTTTGASVEVGEAYTMTATAGKGFWRKMLCVAGSVELDGSDEGEAGTLSFKNTIKGSFRGNGSDVTEFAEILGSANGVVLLARDKSDDLLREIGRFDSPAVKSKLSITNSPKKRQIDFEFIAMGRAPRLLNDVTFPLDFTPSV